MFESSRKGGIEYDDRRKSKSPRAASRRSFPAAMLSHPSSLPPNRDARDVVGGIDWMLVIPSWEMSRGVGGSDVVVVVRRMGRSSVRAVGRGKEMNRKCQARISV